MLIANALSELAANPAPALQNLLQAPASPNATGNFAAANIEQIVRPTGTITRTLPGSVQAGWNTDVILNDGTGIVTIAAPAGVALDGVTAGTTLIFPRQRARFFYDTDGWRTVWVERSPILGTIAIPSGSPVASADLALPLGYTAFELIVHGLKVGTAGAILYARLSEDGGSTYHAGSDYNGSLTEFYNATAYTAYSTMSALAVTGQLGTASTWGTARGIITPGGNGLNASALFQASYYFTGGANATSTSGGNMSANANRQNALRLLFVSGTGSFNAILRGIA
ncbi:MAG: hypothetical protein INR63_32055 [Actinomycetospora chiangmaiensis]|nr:hypothetical protein [Actinomycetospora chiangmaiensis]